MNFEIRSVEENKILMFLPTNIYSKPMKHPTKGITFIEKIPTETMKTALESNSEGLKVHLEHSKLINLASDLEWRAVEDGFEFEVALNNGTEELRRQVADNKYKVSFGFTSLKDSWKKASNNIYERIVENMKISEISLVSNPAYTSSFAETRSLNDLLKKEEIERKKAEARLMYLRLKGEE